MQSKLDNTLGVTLIGTPRHMVFCAHSYTCHSGGYSSNVRGSVVNRWIIAFVYVLLDFTVLQLFKHIYTTLAQAEIPNCSIPWYVSCHTADLFNITNKSSDIIPMVNEFAPLNNCSGRLIKHVQAI